MQNKFSVLSVCCVAEINLWEMFLAGKLVLIMILLAGKKENRSWELVEERGVVGR